MHVVYGWSVDGRPESKYTNLESAEQSIVYSDLESMICSIRKRGVSSDYGIMYLYSIKEGAGLWKDAVSAPKYHPMVAEAKSRAVKHQTKGCIGPI